MTDSNQKIYTFLMFSGQAEEAMQFYSTVFDNSEIISITRYGPNEGGKEGSVMHAVFSLKGQRFMCIDSNVEHRFTFTPAISLYVYCNSESEIARYYSELSQDGAVLMPLSSYPFSAKFGWVQDRFGVSWQLSLK